MSNYRRAYQPGGCYFFTVITHERCHILTRQDAIQRLRAVFRHVRLDRPFVIDAMVVLPDQNEVCIPMIGECVNRKR